MKRYFVTVTVSIPVIVYGPENETKDHIEQSATDAVTAIDFERSMSDGTQTADGTITAIDIDESEDVEEDEE